MASISEFNGHIIRHIAPIHTETVAINQLKFKYSCQYWLQGQGSVPGLLFMESCDFEHLPLFTLQCNFLKTSILWWILQE
jgi:hypothetical protein